QYDPRRIVREALKEEKRKPNAAEALNRAKPPQKPLELGETPPFDLEST
ncbi:MAG: Sec-independent protein translocase TatB, partial [Actinobacteria bacterium]|nr:Sec-independent protein translocase TatB [Actinomycetota bacterium]